METGILGRTVQVRLDAVEAESKAVVSAAADRIEALAAAVREAYGQMVAEGDNSEGGHRMQPDSDLMASARSLLGRLEITSRDLRQISQMLSTREAEAVSASPATTVLEAQEQERRRLAEELHDGPAQALANTVFQAEIVGQAMKRDAASAQAELAALRTLLQHELEKLRSYINELRPPLGEVGGLEEALRDAASDLSAKTDISVDIRLNAPAAALNEAQRAVALRVAQEALRNIGKHASASRAWLATDWTDRRNGHGWWVLEVGDDGRGFDVDAVATRSDRRHFGLRFMRERAQLLGAQLSIDAKPSAGTVVRLSIDTGGERS